MAKPTGDILVYPAHDRCHLLVDFLYTVQVPTDGFVMEYTIAERPECIQRCRYILSFPFLLGHEGERPAQVFPEQTLIFTVEQRYPESKSQLGHYL